MNKTKHILINLTIDEYNAIKLIAEKTQRSITNVAYLLLNEKLEKTIINFIDEKNAGFAKMQFDPFSDVLK